MSQPSVTNYFNTKKRTALDDKLERAKKVLILDTLEEVDTRLNNDKSVIYVNSVNSNNKTLENPGNIKANRLSNSKGAKLSRRAGSKKHEVSKQKDIQELLNNMVAKPPVQTTTKEAIFGTSLTTPETIVHERHVTPPSTPTKVVNRLDKITDVSKEPSLKEIRQKLTRSHRLTELRASIARFKESSQKLEEAEKKTTEVGESPTLKNFKTIEIEVQIR